MNKHCCNEMHTHINHMCDVHDDPYECPDYVISYSEKFDEYGLIIRDGSGSYDISYCPFCGAKLPASKRDQWFEELEKLGIDDPYGDQEIPEAFKTSQWYKST